MVFGLFKKTDPVCGMKEEKGKGTHKHGRWFCNEHCLHEYEDAQKSPHKKDNHAGSCCH